MTAFYKGINRVYFKVGIFSVLILLLFILSFAWLTNRLQTGSQQEISIMFDDVGGLEIGDKVIFRGMEVGRIKSTTISDDGILTRARVNGNLKLMQGATYYVSDSSLMGGKNLVIVQGDGAMPLDTSVVQTGSSKLGIMAVIAKGTEVIDEFKLLLQNIQKQDGLIDKSELFVSGANSSLQKMDRKIDDLETEIRQTIRLANSSISQINSLLTESKEDIGKSVAIAPKLMENASATIDSLRAASIAMNKTLREINSGEGSASKMINDPELYLKLINSIENLDLLIQDIKANPKKYINIRVF